MTKANPQNTLSQREPFDAAAAYNQIDAAITETFQYTDLDRLGLECASSCKPAWNE